MTAGTNTVCRLKKNQVRAAAEMLVRAFQDYPMSRYFQPVAPEGGIPNPRIYQTMIRYGLVYGQVYTTSPALEGVAVWLPSDRVKQTLWRKLRSGDFSVFSRQSREMRSRHRALLDHMLSIHRRHAPFPHLYLRLLGVDPVHQGKGCGSALLNFMFARIDRLRLPCYLETHKEENVAIYQHLGFRVVEEGCVPGSDVMGWAMLRETP